MPEAAAPLQTRRIPRASGWWTGAALWGAGVWAACLAFLDIPLATALLLIGPLVATPLVLGLAQPGGPRARPEGRWRLAALLQAPAATLAAASFAYLPGTVAAALTLPWLAFALLVALLGLLRALERGLTPLPSLAIDAGLAFLSVGAFWLVVSRAGATVLGFGEPIAFLTAAHFHFAGLALPVLGGLAALARPSRLGSAVCLGLIAGMPAVAVGVTLQARGIEAPNAIAATVFAAAATGAALLNGWLALRGAHRATATQAAPAIHLSGASRALLGLSACTLPIGMVLAAAYAIGEATHLWRITLDTMVRTHAVVNVAGFVLPALLAWTLAGVPAERPGLRILLPGERMHPHAWDGRALRANGPREGDRVVRHEVPLGREAPGAPVKGGPFDAAAARVMAYDIFPAPHLVPRLARTPVQAGDTLAAEHVVAPGIRAGFAARVTATFEGPASPAADAGGRGPQGNAWRTGFTYATLEGHPEEGEETFAVEKDERGEVRFVLSAWSRHGHPLARWIPRLAARRQERAVAAALKAMRRAAEPAAPTRPPR